MSFKIAMEHYRSGTADETERRLVEEELEKNRLVAEYLDEQWNEEAGERELLAEADSETAAGELKKLRKQLWKRNAAVVLTSVVLAAAVLLGVIKIGVPAAEKKYWNPEQITYGGEFSTDLELTFAAYTELFTEGRDAYGVSSERTRFAAHNLTLRYLTPDGETSFSYGTLVKDELSIPIEVLQAGAMNVFERASIPEYPMSDESKQRYYERLQELPDYVDVYAAVSFPEDLTMEELIRFEESLEEGHIGWVGIRNSVYNKQLYPLIGMKPFQGGVVWEEINDDFPMFNIKGEERTAENLEQHFKSLLQYSAVQAEAGTGVGPHTAAYYDEVLNYVEENGIYTYGCYITASPKELIRLLDSGTANQVWPQDTWISLW